MTLYKRGKTYWTEFQFDGHRVRQSTGTASKSKAESFEKQLRDKLHEQHKLGRSQEMTLGEAVTHYEATSIATRRKTIDGEKRTATKQDEMRLRQIKAFFGEHEPLSKVASAASLAEYKAHLLTSMQPNSANRVLNTFRA